MQENWGYGILIKYSFKLLSQKLTKVKISEIVNRIFWSLTDQLIITVLVTHAT